MNHQGKPLSEDLRPKAQHLKVENEAEGLKRKQLRKQEKRTRY